MNIKRVLDVFLKEGFHTFKYLVVDNLSERRSDNRKYQDYIRNYENKELEKNKYRNGLRKLGIIILCGSKDAEEFTKTSVLNSCTDIPVFQMGESDTLLGAISSLKCDYVGFISPNDILDKNAISSFLDVIAKNDNYSLIYSDEDIITDGVRHNPVFKPDFSYDTFLSYNYIGGFAVVKSSCIKSDIHIACENNSVLEYMILLDVAVNLSRDQVFHIKEVLLHRSEEINYNKKDLDLLVHFKEKLLYDKMKADDGKSLVTVVSNKNVPIQYVYYQASKPHLISIIIPSKDNPHLIKKCLESIEKYTTMTDYEVIVVDNGSSEENKRKYQQIFNNISSNVEYCYVPMEFNFSKMCNIGADRANGDFLLFLNDDIEVLYQKSIEEQQKLSGTKMDWLGVLLGAAMQRNTGAVGVKLLFPDTTVIQHCGIVNYESGAAHIFSHEKDAVNMPGYRNSAVYNYLCVTGACFIISREKFYEVNGFEEELKVTFNDVDLCMKLYEAGYDNVVRNDVVLYHHESITRGEDALDEEKFHRHLMEREKLFDLHTNLVKYDPYYSIFLTQKRLDASLSGSYYVNNPCRKIMEVDLEKSDINSIILENGFVEGKIQSVALRDNIEIRGYIYNKKINSGKKYLRPCIAIQVNNIVKLFEGIKLYEPTLSRQLKTKNNLNFASFYCCIEQSELEGENLSDCAVMACLKKRRKIYK